jgi:hypothetical protein
MRISTLLTAAAFAVVVAGPALAQPPAPTPEERAAAFDKADANKDGKLDKAEFKTTLAGGRGEQFADQIFDGRDANKDGFISK